MREPAYTLEEKHIRSMARLGNAAVSSANSFRRLVCYSVAILREINRLNAENPGKKVFNFRELQKQDQITLINTMYPMRNAERIEWVHCLKTQSGLDAVIRLHGQSIERKAA